MWMKHETARFDYLAAGGTAVLTATTGRKLRWTRAPTEAWSDSMGRDDSVLSFFFPIRSQILSIDPIEEK